MQVNGGHKFSTWPSSLQSFLELSNCMFYYFVGHPVEVQQPLRFKIYTYHSWHKCKLWKMQTSALAPSSRLFWVFCGLSVRNVDIIFRPVRLWYDGVKVLVSAADSFQSNIKQRMSQVLREHTKTHIVFSSSQILEWVTISRWTISIHNQLSSQLSLAIPPWVSAMSTEHQQKLRHTQAHCKMQ